MSPAPDYEALAVKLSQYVGERRLQHSRNVCATALQLAEFYAPELSDKAGLAGLLHDNAKKLTNDELIAYVKKFDIDASPVELAMPSLLHGKVGALLLPERFGVDDPDVAQAVRDHVAGRGGMGLLSRILYVADQSAADRVFEGVENLRATMKESLERAVFLVAKHKLLAVASRGWLVEPQTVALYNELVEGGFASGG